MCYVNDEHGMGNYDFERRLQKDEARQRDIDLLASGSLTKEDLGEKNTFAKADKIVIDITGAKPLK